ncbi:MAG TPA: DUF5666 domain-containing protein [Candidatus Angelobacter sp.]|nr:DUF5666 domain-containing protein [Candidatus Angelobacter sp.]
MTLRQLPQIALLLALGAGCAIAQPQEQRRNIPPGEMVAGTVKAVGKDSLTVTPLSGGDPVTLKVSDSTRVMKDRQPAKLTDIKAGDTVFARGRLNGNSMEAFIVGVVPAEMAEQLKQGGGRGVFMSGPGQDAFNPEDLGKKFIAGEVKAINETRLTIARPDGQSQDIEVDENTSFKRGSESITLADIKAGDFVRGPGELKNNIFTAKELRVGRPRMQMNFGDGTSPPGPPAEKKAAPAPPN